MVSVSHTGIRIVMWGFGLKPLDKQLRVEDT